jgi:uncharacterized membrane protein
MHKVMRLYAAFREPRNFLVFLLTYIATSLTFHVMRGYDADFGMTNLVLSIEASIASAALMMLGKHSADMQQKNSEDQARMLAAVLAMAEGQRDMLANHTEVLRALKEGDERILQTLTSNKES